MPAIYDVRSPDGRRRGLAAAIGALAAGRLVAMPTETVYGLAADAALPEAVSAVFKAKGRPRFNPLIAHVGSFSAAAELALMDKTAKTAGEAFWPGALTLVLPRRPEGGVCAEATAGLDTIAVRVPAEPVARELLTMFGRPVVAPSANRSGHVSATSAVHVAADLGEAVAVILDEGPSPLGIESTIIELAGGRPTLLRAGAIPRSQIEEALGVKLAAAADVRRDAMTAPGQSASHYAPRAAVRLNATAVDQGEALLRFGPEPAQFAERAVATVNLSESGDLGEAAANLFAALRRLDQAALRIAVEPIPDRGLGEAINDRLRRAAAPRG